MLDRVSNYKLNPNEKMEFLCARPIGDGNNLLCQVISLILNGITLLITTFLMLGSYQREKALSLSEPSINTFRFGNLNEIAFSKFVSKLNRLNKIKNITFLSSPEFL